MKKINLYVVRHGQTMLNALGRVQGWSDSPLTPKGERDTMYLGLGLRDILFDKAYSSDSGRAIQTCKIILEQQSHVNFVPHQTDPRLREWCCGSLEGDFGSHFIGVIPRALEQEGITEATLDNLSFKDILETLQRVDTTGWAQSYEEIKERVWKAMLCIAKTQELSGGGDVLVVAHSLTISFFLDLVDGKKNSRKELKNSCVNIVNYENDAFTVISSNDVSYIEAGEKIYKAENP